MEFDSPPHPKRGYRMKKVYDYNRIPIKSWVPEDELDLDTLEQANNLANLPFSFKHIALMPDSHQGYGMPIGGVCATLDVISPNMVGYDVGCGVACCKLPIKEITQEQIKKIFGGSEEYKGGIRSLVPVGFKHHKKKQSMDLLPNFVADLLDSVIDSELSSAQKQIGTLGGGNHFIEIQKGSDGFIYIMIHSGSRNLGHKVASHYINAAKKLNRKWYSSINPKHDLDFLPVDSQEGQNYLSEMNYCVKFAKASRKLMMVRCIESFLETVDLNDFLMDETNLWDVAHNYVVQEHHFGKNVWIHRKGATRAYEGDIGLIPGSQGTSSYIVKGLGNPESFKSCSHGAGRAMSRTKAKDLLSLDMEKAILDDQGIIHSIRNKSDLDEAPGSYKDITKVMENQKDLVEIVIELKPLGVIKG